MFVEFGENESVGIEVTGICMEFGKDESVGIEVIGVCVEFGERVFGMNIGDCFVVPAGVGVDIHVVGVGSGSCGVFSALLFFRVGDVHSRWCCAVAVTVTLPFPKSLPRTSKFP